MKRFVFIMILAIGVVSVAFASQVERIKEYTTIFYDVGSQTALPQVMSFDTQYCGLCPFSEVIYSANIYELKALKSLPYDHGLKLYTSDDKQIINLTYHTMSKITESELTALKVKYKHIKLITVIVEGEVKDSNGEIITPEESYQFAVRRPDRGHIGMLLPLAQKQEIDEFADKAVKNLVVGGDLEALEDGLVFMGVVSQLKDVIRPFQSFLANA